MSYVDDTERRAKNAEPPLEQKERDETDCDGTLWSWLPLCLFHSRSYLFMVGYPCVPLFALPPLSPVSCLPFYTARSRIFSMVITVLRFLSANIHFLSFHFLIYLSNLSNFNCHALKWLLHTVVTASLAPVCLIYPGTYNTTVYIFRAICIMYYTHSCSSLEEKRNIRFICAPYKKLYSSSNSYSSSLFVKMGQGLMLLASSASESWKPTE